MKWIDDPVWVIVDKKGEEVARGFILGRCYSEAESVAFRRGLIEQYATNEALAIDAAMEDK